VRFGLDWCNGKMFKNGQNKLKKKLEKMEKKSGKIEKKNKIKVVKWAKNIKIEAKVGKKNNKYKNLKKI
jgi:hypothetical protein